jgi:hypothetical protein
MAARGSSGWTGAARTVSIVRVVAVGARAIDKAAVNVFRLGFSATMIGKHTDLRRFAGAVI